MNYQDNSYNHFTDFDAAIDNRKPGVGAFGYIIGAAALIFSVGGAVYFAYEQGVNDTLQVATPVIHNTSETVFITPDKKIASNIEQEDNEIYRHMRSARRAPISPETTKPLIIQLLAKKIEQYQVDSISKPSTLPKAGSDITTATIGKIDNDLQNSTENIDSIEVSKAIAKELGFSIDETDGEAKSLPETAMADITEANAAQTDANQIDYSQIVDKDVVVVQSIDGNGSAEIRPSPGSRININDSVSNSLIDDAVDAVQSSQGSSNLQLADASAIARKNNISAEQIFAAANANRKAGTLESSATNNTYASLSNGITETNVNVTQYFAQVATLSSIEAATREWADVVRRHPVLSEVSPVINESKYSSGKKAFQLRIGPYQNRDEAKQMCEALLQGGERDCAVRRS